MNNTLRTITLAGTTFLATIAFAQESGNPPSYARNQGIQGQPPNGNQGPGGQGGMGRHGPPPEAISACASKNQEIPCSFVTPRGDTINGTCRQVPEGKFACVPQNMGGPGGGVRRMQGGPQDGTPPGGQ